MNKVYISYFYNIRFMNKDFIPISTALSDPKWFHHNTYNKNFIFYDKNDVINGLREERLMPGPTCQDLCHGTKGCSDHPSECQFLINYRKQLDEIDFDKFSQDMEEILADYYSARKICANLVFIVYEVPDNPCSERGALIEWFKSHNVEVEEWNKSMAL